MERNKTLYLKAGIFGGVALWAIQIFIDNALISNILKFVGIIVMFLSVLFFVAGDVILSLFKKKSSVEVKEDKEKKMNEDYDAKLRELEIKRRELELAKQEAELNRQLRDVKKEDEFKMPDVMGNVAPFFGINEEKKTVKSESKEIKAEPLDKLDHLKELF